MRAFEALGCEGLARVDFFVTEHGDVLVNEVNTMPGFTPVSMFPLMWATRRTRLPAAGRPAAPARPAASYRVALTPLPAVPGQVQCCEPWAIVPAAGASAVRANSSGA